MVSIKEIIHLLTSKNLTLLICGGYGCAFLYKIIMPYVLANNLGYLTSFLRPWQFNIGIDNVGFRVFYSNPQTFLAHFVEDYDKT
jgi:hypothetical protein